MIIRYPSPLSFRLNNDAIIPKEYLSMTKYLVFEVGFSEKPYSSRSEKYGKEGNLTQQKTRLRRERRTATRVVTSPEVTGQPEFYQHLLGRISYLGFLLLNGAIYNLISVGFYKLRITV